MPTTFFQPEPCNRREFMIAAGVFIAGGVASCSGGKEKVEPAPIEIEQAKPPTDIRVRIGKIRNGEQLSIGGSDISTAKLFSSNGSNPSAVVGDYKGVVVETGKQTKKITGKILLHARQDISKGALDVVAHVPLELYLPGVLAGELLSHWHLATFSAQAVAARSYALWRNSQRKKTSHFDVTDGPSSQVFLGDVELDVAHRAVKETEGVVLTWQNELIPSYYSACCGGIAALATDAISSSPRHNIPPLFGHVGDDACKQLDIHKWSTSRNSRTLRRRLNASAKRLNIPNLQHLYSIRSIVPAKTNRHGRPTHLAIKDRRRKTIEVSARDFIRAANASVSTLPAPKEQLWSPFLVGKRSGTEIQLDGYGMGHGVGLCQYGAQELAGQDYAWEDILAWYYPQATIENKIPAG